MPIEAKKKETKNKTNIEMSCKKKRTLGDDIIYDYVATINYILYNIWP